MITPNTWLVTQAANKLEAKSGAGAAATIPPRIMLVKELNTDRFSLSIPPLPHISLKWLSVVS